jgi:hypothetical protein
MNNLGIHVFEQTKVLDHELELLNFNLISALSWRKFHGPIHLYCNQDYLNTLKKWGVDTVYDYINTDVLDNKTNDIDYVQYWAFSKFIVLNHLVKLHKTFTLIDNDLWFLSPLDIKNSFDVMMYHREEFDLKYDKNIYVDFDYMLPEHLKLSINDKSILPTNAAILYVKNSNDIITWINTAFEIAKYNFGKSKDQESPSTKMCFVEQRLLPIVLSKQNINYGTFISQNYITQNIDLLDGSEWYPRIEDSITEEQERFNNIKHVWGLKKFLKYKEIWQLVISLTLEHLNQYQVIDKPYEKLVTNLIEEFNNSLANP